MRAANWATATLLVKTVACVGRTKTATRTFTTGARSMTARLLEPLFLRAMVVRVGDVGMRKPTANVFIVRVGVLAQPGQTRNIFFFFGARRGGGGA